jgi:hypothetical protein
MQLEDDALREIEDALVGATLNPATWPDTVSTIVTRSRSHGAVVLPLQGRVPGLPISPSCEGLIDSYFSQGWAERDHRRFGIPKLMQTGVLVDQDISTPDFMRSSEYYNDFLGRFGFRWFAGLKVAVGDDIWCLTLQRTAGQGPFEDREQSALRRLIPPLSRMARLAQIVSSARLQGIAETLEALGVAGALIDRTGRAIRINTRADSLLGTDLDVVNDWLCVRGDRRSTAALQAHIAAAIWSDIRPDDPALNPIVIRQHHATLVIHAQPLRKAGLEYLDGARAIVTILQADIAGDRILPSPSRRA